MIVLRLFFFSICYSLILQTVYANPQKATISEGSVSIKVNQLNYHQHQLEIIQQSDRAIIDWESFDIAEHESTRFVQPNSNAVALNRIHSNTSSKINGQLTANGRIILVNQNGILFGQSAKVDINGLLATTANISDVDWTNKCLIFDQPGKKDSRIVNRGEITTQDGLVGLVAPNVVNTGLIIAKASKVVLASGETFALDLYGDQVLNVAVSDQVKHQLLSNRGEIIADGNQIILTAAAGKELVNSLIINSGTLRARSVAQQRGAIIITAEGSNAVNNNVTSLKGLKQGESKAIITTLL
jgi:filamentous hemagglutinin family protein